MHCSSLQDDSRARKTTFWAALKLCVLIVESLTLISFSAQGSIFSVLEWDDSNTQHHWAIFGLLKDQISELQALAIALGDVCRLFEVLAQAKRESSADVISGEWATKAPLTLCICRR